MNDEEDKRSVVTWKGGMFRSEEKGKGEEKREREERGE